MPQPINIWQTSSADHKTFYCGIGDGVHDGLYGSGPTAEAAALDFVSKLVKDKQFAIIDITKSS